MWNLFLLINMNLVKYSWASFAGKAKPVIASCWIWQNPAMPQVIRVLDCVGIGRGKEEWIEEVYNPCATLLTCGGPRCELWIKMKGVFWPSHCGLEGWLDFFSVQFLQGEKQITVSINVYSLSIWRQTPLLPLGCPLSAPRYPCWTDRKGWWSHLALALLVSLKSVPWMVPAHFSYWNPEYKLKCSWQKN